MIKITTLFVKWNEGYTTSMSIFVKATEAARPRTQASNIAALVLAALVTIMVVGQLFTYEKFAEVIDKLGFLPDKGAAAVVAALIVVFEVGSLPFLLRMRLSPLACIVSMAAGWIMLIFWLGLSLWLNITLSLASNGGVLGDTIQLPVDWWMVSFFIALATLDGWACYGLWPSPLLRKK
jgi:hypothetical protein